VPSSSIDLRQRVRDSYQVRLRLTLREKKGRVELTSCYCRGARRTHNPTRCKRCASAAMVYSMRLRQGLALDWRRGIGEGANASI